MSLITRARAAIARWAAPSAPPGAPAPARRPHQRRFEAARVDRLSADWLATQNSLNQDLNQDLDRLRARARDLAKNNDYAAKFIGMCRANIIGPGGIRLQARVEDRPGHPDGLANAAIESAWRQWSAGACDIRGRQSLRDICETLVGGLPSDGEFLVRLVRGPDSGNPYGLALQLIDVDRIDTTYNAELSNGGSIKLGIETDAYGRPVAIHIFNGHPNDGAGSNRQRTRLSTTETLHCYRLERADQRRGIPWMAPGMLSLKHLGSFGLAALLAAEHGANHFGFFTTPDGEPPVGEQDPVTGEKISTSQPGTYDTLPPGVTFQPHESKYPNDVFAPFVKSTLQRIASGWRVAYHSLANDLEGVSYSSIRSGALEERDRWAADQEWFIAAFLEPIFHEWLRLALISGAITMPNGAALPASKLTKFARHEWQPRRWEWVDPKSDMEAKILAVKAGLMAPQDLAASMGYDFDDTLAAIAAAQKAAQSLGVGLTAYDATPGAAPQAQPTQPDAGADQAAAIGRELQALREAQDTLSHTIATAVRSAPATPPPVVHNHYTWPEQRTEVHNHLPEPVTNVEAVIQAAAAPNVTVAVERADMPAPVINVAVAPADVIVNNTHPSRAVQHVERDADDEIIRTVTTYEA